VDPRRVEEHLRDLVALDIQRGASGGLRVRYVLDPVVPVKYGFGRPVLVGEFPTTEIRVDVHDDRGRRGIYQERIWRASVPDPASLRVEDMAERLVWELSQQAEGALERGMPEQS
jgi:hypothetical protein